jgi:AraC-like DNA-binding protein
MNIDRARFQGLGYNAPPLPWHLGAHSHRNGEIIVVISGSQTVHMRGRNIVGEAGDILFYPPNCDHEEWADAGQTFATHFFSFVWPDCPEQMPLQLRDRRGRVRVLLDWLQMEKRMPSPITPVVNQSLFQAILAEILRLWLHPEDDLVDRIRSHAAGHMQDSITLEQLAALSGMSKFHFVRKYKTLTGVTPMEDLRILRVERARDLIMTTDRPIKTIAEDVGFASVYHLCRLFKQRLGVPPGSLRRRPGRSRGAAPSRSVRPR